MPLISRTVWMVLLSERWHCQLDTCDYVVRFGAFHMEPVPDYSISAGKRRTCHLLFRYCRCVSWIPLVQFVSSPGVYGRYRSLALGGIIGALCVLIKKEFLLPTLGGVFLMETVSVIIQRMYSSIRKKIRRRKTGFQNGAYSSSL